MKEYFDNWDTLVPQRESLANVADECNFAHFGREREKSRDTHRNLNCSLLFKCNNGGATVSKQHRPSNLRVSSQKQRSSRVFRRGAIESTLVSCHCR